MLSDTAIVGKFRKRPWTTILSVTAFAALVAILAPRLAGSIVTWSGSQPACANAEEYFSLINDPDGGLVRERNVRGIDFTLRYLPTDDLVYRRVKKHPLFSDALVDSLQHVYSKSVGFQLAFGADGVGTQGDVTYLGVNNYEEYAARVREINFGLEEMLELHAGDKVFRPKLAVAENTYSLSNERKVMIMFSDVELLKSMQNEDEVVMVFDDRIFGGGIMKYRFNTNAINNVPAFPFAALPNYRAEQVDGR